jgi:hypothetical protein
MVKDAGRREVESERWASRFDGGYYRKLLEKAGGKFHLCSLKTLERYSRKMAVVPSIILFS